MAKRKVAGEQGLGSVFLRQDGRWCAVLDLGWARGRRVRKHFYGRSQEAVEAKLEQAREQTKMGLPITRDRHRRRSARFTRTPDINGTLAVVTELDAALQQRILDAVGIGMAPDRAALFCGVPPATFENWSAKADKGVEPYAALMHACDVTGATHEARLAAVANQDALDNSNLAFKILAVTHPTRWNETVVRTAGERGLAVAGLSIYINLNVFNRPDTEDVIDAQDAAALRRAKILGPVQ